MLDRNLQPMLNRFADKILACEDQSVMVAIYGALQQFGEPSTAADAQLSWAALDAIIGEDYFDYLYTLSLMDQIDFERALIAEVYARWPKAGAE